MLDDSSTLARRGGKVVPRSAVAVALTVTSTLSLHAHADDAPRAAYATPQELASEAVPHLAELGIFARHERSIGEAPRPVSSFDGALSARVLIGRSATYCLGLDGHGGGGSPGASYGATAYLAGIGFRSSNASFIAACAGLGFDARHDVLPFGFAFHPEVRAALTLGPLRPVAWFRPSYQFSDARRVRGAERPFDDYQMGLWLRWGAQHRYWRDVSAGGGPALGFSYANHDRIQELGFWIGLDFAGGE